MDGAAAFFLQDDDEMSLAQIIVAWGVPDPPHYHCPLHWQKYHCGLCNYWVGSYEASLHPCTPAPLRPCTPRLPASQPPRQMYLYHLQDTRHKKKRQALLHVCQP